MSAAATCYSRSTVCDYMHHVPGRKGQNAKRSAPPNLNLTHPAENWSTAKLTYSLLAPGRKPPEWIYSTLLDTGCLIMAHTYLLLHR